MLLGVQLPLVIYPVTFHQVCN